MKTNWQYKVVEFESSKAFLPANRSFDLGAMQAELNTHGADGWELVSTVPTAMDALKFAALLKRPANAATTN